MTLLAQACKLQFSKANKWKAGSRPGRSRLSTANSLSRRRLRQSLLKSTQTSLFRIKAAKAFGPKASKNPWRSIRYKKGVMSEIEKQYWVGQEGEFPLRDALGNPSGTVRGRIVSILKGEGYFFLFVETAKNVQLIQII
jgi:hypothetical protein